LSIPLSAIHHISNWWLLLVFGVVLPIALGIGNRIALSYKAKGQPPPGIQGEKELLELLERQGELTALPQQQKLPSPSLKQTRCSVNLRKRVTWRCE
jgi:hypothetical protein